jgi:hypothetical protein
MKHNKITPVLMLMLASTWCFAQNSNFSYKRKLNAVPQEGWYTLTLPPDIFVHCHEQYNDLRLYSIQGNDTVLVPYLLKERNTEIKEQEVELTAINRSKKDGTLFMTFELQPGQKTNYLDLHFEEANYFAFVKVEGSQDKKQWFDIVNQQRIFAIANASVSYQHGVVVFPVSDYSYLRVSVRSDTPLTFGRVLFRHQQVSAGKFTNIPSRQTVRHDKNSKQTFIDLVPDHYRPVANVTIITDNKSDYYRSCELAVLTDSIQTQRGWVRNFRTATQGYLTSFKPNTFTFDNETTGLLQLTINNLDNAPLNILDIKVEGPEVELIANLKPGDTYLFYGNQSLPAPVYDITYFAEKIPAEPAAVTLGPEENIAAPASVSHALFENKLWLWGIMIAVIGVLGFFTLKMMKGNTASSQ